MQDAVAKALEGKFNSDIHSLEFSSPVIELGLRSGEIYEGSFTISGPENEMTEGTVSSTRLKMECLTSRFSGCQEEIAYRFDASGMEEGDSFRGEFRVISNHGEYYIPYDIHIISETLDSELGEIRNLFHFANLARTNWKEAVSLFYSKDFEKVFSGVDRQYYGIYRGLAGGAGREQNVEEFLLEIKKKQKTEFVLEETEVRMENPRGMETGRLIINRNGWGYSELFLEADGDFLILEKDRIGEADFQGNSCRLPFYVSAEKLHGGRNYGSIRLYNAYVSLSARITVIHQSSLRKVPGIRKQKRHKIAEMMQFYEAFRIKKISAASWMKRTEELLNELTQMDGRDVSLKLFKAQLLITQERANEAEWYLNQSEKEVKENFDPATYCYYLYLTTLLGKPDVDTDEAAAQVERIFVQNSGNWRIAWLLLYISDEYSKSPSRKWMILEEQMRQGCKSPVLYIEAWNLIAANPALLMRMEDFELQVLFYAAKKEILTPEVIIQIVYLAQKMKNYSERLFVILKACYKTAPNNEVLQAICTLLIKGNITEPFSFPWYEMGIKKELRITRLYEHYMMALPLAENREIPKIVLMYFAFDSTLDSLHNAFLYAYVHRNRGQFPDLYENYREQIERFVVFQILRGKTNRYLAYLYKNLITQSMLTEETAKGLSTVLFMRRVTVRREDIRRLVLVYEKEKYEAVYPIAGRENYIPIYGSDCRLFLEDAEGNRYCREEEYTCERLLVPDQPALMIAPYVTGCVHFDLWLCERGDNLSAVTAENVMYMKRLVESEQILDETCREIRMRLIDFFYDNDRIQELDEFLEALTPAQVENRCFAQAVRFLVLRGMYEKAYEWIREKDDEGVEAKIIMRLCSRLLALGGIAVSEDAAAKDAAASGVTVNGMEENPAMTVLVFQAFRAGKYDENMLEYLCSFFAGTSKEMRDVWKAAEAFGVNTYGLSERILIQMLYTGAYLNERTEIFKSYVSGGARSEVELAALSLCSYDYFVKNKQIDSFVLEDMLRAAERQEELPLVCKLAYVKYYAENKKQVDEQISRYLILFLRELLAKNIYFPFFKEYAGHIAFMRRFMDKTMIEYRTRNGNKAFIHYLMEKDGNGGEEYRKEEMRDMYGGICVKEFVLFFGEHLQYYITELFDGKENLTQSGTLSHNDANGEQTASRYALLNDIAIGRNLHDYDTMESLLYEYFEQDFVVKKLFYMI
ncbi:MAG: DUF5717 family protein [Clostridium sp.]|nr:DUF5717 family protein [Clostridium sp.]